VLDQNQALMRDSQFLELGDQLVDRADLDPAWRTGGSATLSDLRRGAMSTP
jgi:hypothetical protein